MHLSEYGKPKWAKQQTHTKAHPTTTPVIESLAASVVGQECQYRKVVILVRVSTPHQGKAGIGKDCQRAGNAAYVQERHLEVVEEFSETASAQKRGKLSRRPVLVQALDAALEAKAGILVYDFSRLTRRLDVLREIQARYGDVPLISATESSNPASISAAVARAEAEGKAISARTKAGQAASIAKGNPPPGNPGIRDVQPKARKAIGKRTRDLDEKIADVLAELSDVRSHRVIAKALNDRGLRTARGNRWTESNLPRPLGRARKVRRERASDHYRNRSDFGLF